MKSKNKNDYERNLAKDSRLIIKEIVPDSIAEELELEPGDEILKINNKELKDELDFYYLISEDDFELEVKKKDEEIWLLEIERDFDEDVGIILEESLETKTCSNNCVFCFIDQMPPGMRDSLYVKDDDERLSFLTGNYITLTNLSEDDLERICKWKIPVNISIHTTDPILRTKMLRSKDAGNSLKKLDRLNESGIQMNAQIVLVPGYNDKDLIRSLKDLSAYYPNLQSVSVVPVGLTKFRQGLAELRKFKKEEAVEIIKNINSLIKELERDNIYNFVYLSDEFYLLAEEAFPDYNYYNNFDQLENGVGMITDFSHDFYEELESNNTSPDNKKRLVLTGNLAKSTLEDLLKQLKNKYPMISSEIMGINNNFFGKNITVSGLLTATDIIDQLKQVDLKNIEEILLPDSLIRNGTTTLLDDYSVSDLEEIFKIPFKLVKVNGKDFYKSLIGDNNG